MNTSPVDRLASKLAEELIRDGALAVILVGSRARGDAHPESDLDLHAIGQGPPDALARREGVLVSVAWRTAEQHRAAFKSPKQALQAVPAWRDAVILTDPQGIAAAIQREAIDWSWKLIAAEADTFAADEVTGLAEEVHKLVISLERGQQTTAAIQRAALVIGLGQAMAVRCRLLVETENRLWDAAAEAMGTEWARCQSAALGLGGESFEATCRAALDLYRLAADTVWPLLDDGQRQVVSHACELARHVNG